VLQTVSFDTNVDAGIDVLTAIAYAYGYESPEDLVADAGVEEDEEPEGAPPPSAAPYGWTRPKMKRYVTALRPIACKVLRSVADGAPRTRITDVQRAAGVQGVEFAGAMSSFGFAARNTRGVKTRPFEKIRDDYQMDEAVAELAIEVLDELGR
jgi:hypothetical protein